MTMATENDFPQVHFGRVDTTPVDWRQSRPDADDLDADDDVLEKTPEYIVRMLGFDPREWLDGDGNDVVHKIGTADSGHWGHAGRPGEVGGSLPGAGESGETKAADKLCKELFGETNHFISFHEEQSKKSFTKGGEGSGIRGPSH